MVLGCIDNIQVARHVSYLITSFLCVSLDHLYCLLWVLCYQTGYLLSLCKSLKAIEIKLSCCSSWCFVYMEWPAIQNKRRFSSNRLGNPKLGFLLLSHRWQIPHVVCTMYCIAVRLVQTFRAPGIHTTEHKPQCQELLTTWVQIIRVRPIEQQIRYRICLKSQTKNRGTL